jgi:hypothetical protein
MYTNTVFSASVYAVSGSTTPISSLLPLLHDMFRSHKDHGQMCMLLLINSPHIHMQETQPHAPTHIQAYIFNKQIYDIKRGAATYDLSIFKF